MTENSLPLSAGSMADSLRSSLVNLQMEIIKLQVKGYAPDHPQIKNLNAQIANVKSRLLEELQKITQKNRLSPMPQIQSLLDQIPPLEIQRATMTARETALKTILSQYDFGLSKLPNKELQLARLLRAKEVGRKRLPAAADEARGGQDHRGRQDRERPGDRPGPAAPVPHQTPQGA